MLIIHQHDFQVPCDPSCSAYEEFVKEMKAAVQEEMVNHPRHYNEHPSGVECIDIIEHMSHNVGAAIKYLWRAGLKPGNSTLQDLHKAAWYINREIQRVDQPGQEKKDV